MKIDLVGKKDHKSKVINIGNDVKISSNSFSIIAGPCAIESIEQIEETAKFLSSLNVKLLRGGAFKPRTSPYSFQGLGFKGLQYIKNAADKYKMKVVSEVIDPRHIEKCDKYIDIFQIGSRNMQNYSLLKEIGRTQKPVLLKRGMTSTVKEWLMAAEYIAVEGNDNIILCERGIRTFENYTRNTLDLTVVPIIKNLSKLPIIIDPSHGTGRKDLVIPMSKAAVTIMSNGIIVEVHPNPEEALSDGFQSLNFNQFKNLVKQINALKKCMSTL